MTARPARRIRSRGSRPRCGRRGACILFRSHPAEVREGRGCPRVPTSGLPDPSRASPSARSNCQVCGDRGAPVAGRICSWLKARWITPSDSAAAFWIPSRSSRSPRHGVCAELAVTVAAACPSDRARPTTSMARRDVVPGTIAEPRWPDAPVTKTRRGPLRNPLACQKRASDETWSHHGSK